MSSAHLDKPDIVTVLENEGLQLKQRGKDFWGLCPFHDEKTPSFKVNPDRQLYYCFSCHEHGDIISAIQKLKGVSFKNTLEYLGISNGRRVKPDPVKSRAREIRKQYEAWKHEYCLHLADMLRQFDRKKTTFTDTDQVEQCATLYHQATTWELDYSILTANDEKMKFELFRERTRV
jgi:DNA primase